MPRKKGTRSHPDRLIVDDFGTAKLYHHCSRCRGWLEAHMGNFTPLRRDTKTRQVLAWDFYCRSCRNAYKRDWWASLTREERRFESRRRREYSKKAEPEIQAERLERHRLKQAEYRDRHPERHRRSQKAYWEQLKADPKRYAAYLERQRMGYRLRAERQGKQITRRVPSAVNAWRELTGGSSDRMLPAEPFREWLTTVLETHDNLKDAARRLDVEERTIRRVLSENQPTVSMTVVDRALTRHGRPVRVNGYGPVMFLWDLWAELAT